MSDTTPKTQAAKPQTAKLGTIVELPDGVLVQRPDGNTYPVAGGGYFYDVPGIFIVDGTEVEVTV